MWVEFLLEDTTDSPKVQCLTSTRRLLTLMRTPNQRSLLQYMAAKLNIDVASTTDKGTAKINVKLDDFNSLVRLPPQHQLLPSMDSHGNADMVAILGFIEWQQNQIARQQQVLPDLVRNVSFRENSSRTPVRPDELDSSASTESWISFYEHTCQHNLWTTAG